MKTLFIRNLSFTTSEEELRAAFEVFGPVHRCSIAKNRETGESRGFGFVDMEDDAAVKAIADMNGKALSNRNIIVQESDPKARSGPGAGPRPSGPRPAASSSGPRGPSGAGGGGGSTGSTSAGAKPPAGRNFGPPSQSVSDRKTFHERPKDRLKPYKRGQFNFRDALQDEEEGGRPGDKKDDSGGDKAE